MPAPTVTSLSQLVLTGRRQVATVRVGELKHPSNWVRQDTGTKEERQALARSYQARANNLILISPDGTIRDGNRRVAAIIEDAGPDTPVQVCVTEEEITAAVALEIQIETAEHTKPLTAYEQFVAFSEWLKLTGNSARDLAERVHLHDSTIAKILSLSKCEPPVQEAAKTGRIGISGWYQCSKSPDQAATLSLLLNGATREEVAKRTKKPKSQAVRTQKLKFHVPATGHLITVAGDELSLEETLEVLAEASKAIRDAVKKGITAKSFASAMADIAAAG